MLWLLDKQGDNNLWVRNVSADTLKAMITNPAVGVYPLVEKITMGEIKATTATSHKHVYGRINILRHIVNKYTVNTDDVPLEPVLGQAFMALKHREEDVRLVAYQLMFEMYKVIG